MLTNKWIQFAISLLITLDGFAVTFNWLSVTNATVAGAIVAVAGTAKMILNALAPAAGVSITATGNSLITHKAD